MLDGGPRPIASGQSRQNSALLLSSGRGFLPNCKLHNDHPRHCVPQPCSPPSFSLCMGRFNIGPPADHYRGSRCNVDQGHRACARRASSAKRRRRRPGPGWRDWSASARARRRRGGDAFLVGRPRRARPAGHPAAGLLRRNRCLPWLPSKINSDFQRKRSNVKTLDIRVGEVLIGRCTCRPMTVT
jgi:hypothetical protein